jgi:Protein of unknown function (DUF2934)
MEDITLCGGGSCPLKNRCYRYTAEVFGRQDFFGSMPFNSMTNQCDYFFDNSEQIKKQAYLIWLAQGKPEGQEIAHWVQAEEEISKG